MLGGREGGRQEGRKGENPSPVVLEPSCRGIRSGSGSGSGSSNSSGSMPFDLTLPAFAPSRGWVERLLEPQRRGANQRTLELAKRWAALTARSRITVRTLKSSCHRESFSSSLPLQTSAATSSPLPRRLPCFTILWLKSADPRPRDRERGEWRRGGEGRGEESDSIQSAGSLLAFGICVAVYIQ